MTHGVEVHQDEKDRPPKTVLVTVNAQDVRLPDREVTGLDVKRSAIDQGVPIELGFQLSVRDRGRYRVVGDEDLVKVKKGEEFLAVAPDDNS